MKTKLLTIDQFCEAANCGRTRAYQLINQQEIMAVKNGRKTLIPHSELMRWMESLQPYKSND